MARADRGPLLSSLVLVGLATVATAALVLIGVQAGKISFSTDKSSGSERSEDGGTVIGVDGQEEEVDPPEPTATQSSSRRPTASTSTLGTSGEGTDDPGTSTDGGTPVVTRTTAPATEPKPSATRTTSKPTATATATTATARPSPSQTTATSRPTRPPSSPSPSPSCTATDRSGKCKQAEPQGNSSSPQGKSSSPPGVASYPISF